MDEISVSDHAVIRFLERVNGVDIEAIRAEIRQIVDGSIRSGATSLSVDGFCYTFDPKRLSVISVLTPEMRNKGKTPKPKKRDTHWLRNAARRDHRSD